MNGALPDPEETSSAGPYDSANDEYLFYSDDDSELPIPSDYRNGKGMVRARIQYLPVARDVNLGFTWAAMKSI